MVIKYNDTSPNSEANAIERDCRSDVCVLIGTNLYSMDIYGIDRLHAEVEAEILEDGFYNIYPGLIIVREVSCKEIEKTLYALYNTSYFDGLAPTEYLVWYNEDDEMLISQNLVRSKMLCNAEDIAMFESSVFWLRRFRKRNSFRCMLQCLHDNSGNTNVMNYLFRAVLSMSSCEFFVPDIISYSTQIMINGLGYLRQLYKFIVCIDNIRENFVHELMQAESKSRYEVINILSHMANIEDKQSVRGKLVRVIDSLT